MDVKELYVLLTANTSQFKAAMAGAEVESEGFKGKIASLGKVAKDSFIVAGAAAAGFLVDAALQGEKYTVALSKLTQAQKDAGTSLPITQLQSWQKQMEGLGLTYIQTTDAVTTMTEMHIPLNEQLRTLTAAQNLAAGTGLDLNSSLKAISLMAQGQASRAMTMYGIALPPVIDSNKQLSAATKTLTMDQNKYNDMVELYGSKSKEAASAMKTVRDQGALVNAIVRDQKDGVGNLSGALDALNQRFGGLAAATEKADPMHRMAIAFQDAATAVGVKLQPAIGKLADWIESTGIPAFNRFSDWFEHTGLPAIETFGGNVNRSVIQPLIDVAKVVIPPVLSAFKWLSDHMTLVEMAAGAWFARWVAIKGLRIADEVLQWAGAMRTFAATEGGVNAVLATIGMGGNGGLSGALRGVAGDWRAFGKASGEGVEATETVISKLPVLGTGAAEAAEGLTAAEGAAGAAGLGFGALATGGVLVLGAALVGLATDAGGVRTSLKNALFGEDVGSAMKRNEKSVDDFRTSIIGVANDTDKAQMVQGILNARLQTLEDSHAGVDQLKNSLGDAQAVMEGLKNGTMSADDALQTLYNQGDEQAKKFLDQQRKTWQEMATTAQHTDHLMQDQNASTYNAMKQNLQSLADKQGLQGQKAIDWVNAQMNAWLKMNPQFAAANSAFQMQAKYLGMSIDQAELFGSETVSAMADAKRAIDNANRSAEALASNLGKGIDYSGVAGGGVRNARATGGPVHGEGDVLVGERGPEILHLGRMVGTVTSNVNLPALSGQAQGGHVTNINIGHVAVSGVQNIQDLYNKLREAALYQSRGQGVRSNFGSYA